ncbi:hypothetical protein [Heyndrickxia camelliae]|uniref:Uncharacterized protein n=1 Tax=Heyndrickxia camelliae TaxID=1707093 RepID=A0A2N3LNJ6_9BACI|nr:hypothetical protein [Heyndrickxia camelliae]PKR86093.1 hypothetical protein CWO92_06900 [Heyndrickxia camelliae]
MANTFTYNYKPISYADAQKKVAGQVDPLFNQGVKNIQSQKYANDVQAGQVAAARGLGHSGLAADQLNKIAIAAQGQIADLNAQRATQIAQLANDEVWKDKDYSLQNRSQLYNEWNSNRNYNYQVGRDKVADKQWQTQFDYQKSRDKVSDSQWQKEFNENIRQYGQNYALQKLQYELSKKVQLGQLSLDQAQFAFQKAQAAKKGSGGGGGGSSRSSSSSKKKSTTVKSSQLDPKLVSAANLYNNLLANAKKGKTSERLINQPFKLAY